MPKISDGKVKSDDFHPFLSLIFQVCVQDFCEELEYWGLSDLHLEPCCQHTYYRQENILKEAN